jgi:mRNA-degrading endonuclease toxin of MazEF toxin-antitoxin module
MDTDEPPFVHLTQGARSASVIRSEIKHDLGDRTLVVVILLAIVIGACGYEIGLSNARLDMQSQYMNDVAAKQQIMINHMKDVETKLEKSDVKR